MIERVVPFRAPVIRMIIQFGSKQILVKKYIHCEFNHHIIEHQIGVFCSFSLFVYIPSGYLT